MKKYLLMTSATILVVLTSCQQKNTLTDEQKATLGAEVQKQFSDVMSNLSKLDIDLWTEQWSKDEFISVNSGVKFFSTFNEFRDSVKNWFSLRERQQVEIIETKVKILAPDLALLTSITNWDIQFKNGVEGKSKALETMLWRKETSGWKSIYLHESWKGN